MEKQNQAQSTFKKDLGAIWVKESAKGDKYLTLTIEIEGVKHSLVGFKNNFKTEGSNQPDYRLYKSEMKKNVGV